MISAFGPRYYTQPNHRSFFEAAEFRPEYSMGSATLSMVRNVLPGRPLQPASPLTATPVLRRLIGVVLGIRARHLCGSGFEIPIEAMGQVGGLVRHCF